MIEIIIAIVTILVAIVSYAGATRLLRESVETVTVWDYQAGLHFRHGRFVETLEAGKHRFWGRGNTVILYDLRLNELVVSSQELITVDSATLKLTAVAQWRIGDVVKFHAEAEDTRQALYTRIQLALREVIGSLELDEIMEQKARFGRLLLEAVRTSAAEDLGVEVLSVEVRDLMLGSELKQAYAGVLTARKQAQVRQEQARGEAAALRTLANASRAFEKNPELFRLRYLDTIEKAGTAGFGNQLILGVPEEMISSKSR